MTCFYFIIACVECPTSFPEAKCAVGHIGALFIFAESVWMEFT